MPRCQGLSRKAPESELFLIGKRLVEGAGGIFCRFFCMKMDFHLEDQRHKKRLFMKIVFVDLSDLEQKIHETTRSWISGDAPLVKMAAIRKSFLADKIVGYGHPLRMGSQPANLPSREMCARSFFRAASDPADLESKIKKDVESFFSA